MPWRLAGAAFMVASALIQVWLSGRLGSPGAEAAVMLDYIAIMASFVLALAGIGLIVLGRDARPLFRDRD